MRKFAPMKIFRYTVYRLPCYILSRKENKINLIKTELQNMLGHNSKTTRKSIKKLRFTCSRIFNFTFIIELWMKMSLSKHKSHNSAAVQRWSSGSTKPCHMHALVRVPLEAILLFFLTFLLQIDARKVCLHVFEMYRLQFKIKTRAK